MEFAGTSRWFCQYMFVLCETHGGEGNVLLLSSPFAELLRGGDENGELVGPLRDAAYA